MCYPDGLNILLSQGYVLETAPNVGMMGRISFQSQELRSEEHLITRIQLVSKPAMSLNSVPLHNILPFMISS